MTGLVALELAALALPAVAVGALRGAAAVWLIVFAIVLVLAIEALFSGARRRSFSWRCAPAALVVAILLPVDLPLWQAGLALGFGVLLGDLVFGGRGFGFVAAPVVALSFLLFSFPQSGLAVPEPSLALATVPGAVLLLATGIVSWRVVVLAPLAYLTAAQLMGDGFHPEALIAMSFGLVFLTGDATGAASTREGRVLYGALTGFLWALFDANASTGATQAALVFATLLASIFAPLIDHFVVEIHVARRKRRLV